MFLGFFFTCGERFNFSSHGLDIMFYTNWQNVSPIGVGGKFPINGVIFSQTKEKKKLYIM